MASTARVSMLATLEKATLEWVCVGVCGFVVCGCVGACVGVCGCVVGVCWVGDGRRWVVREGGHCSNNAVHLDVPRAECACATKQ